MNERRHPHFTHIFEGLAASLVPILFFVSSLAMPDEEMGEPLLTLGQALLVMLGMILIVLLFLFIQWRNIWIYMTGDTLYIERGVLAKKKRAIPFNKINTIDLRRNIFERIFGTARLKIDTGSLEGSTGGKAEMDLVFTVAQCEEIRRYILTCNSEENSENRAAGTTLLTENREPDWTVRASFGDFFLYGLTSSSIARFFLVLLAGVAFIGELTPVAYDLLADFGVEVADTVTDFVSGKELLTLVIIGVILFAILYLISNTFTILYAAIRFYNFRAAREGDNIVIRYGLISLKSYTLPVENIHACTVKQNLMQQILGRASVEVSSVGYGNEENENALLFPIVKLSKLPELLNKLLPEYDVQLEKKKADKSGIVMHIVMPIIYWAAFCAMVIIICSAIFEDLILTGTLLAIFTVMLIVNAVMRYKHAAIGLGETAISIESGGMKYQRCIVRCDAVQSVSTRSGVLGRLFGQCGYTVHFHAPFAHSYASVRHLPDDYIDQLADKIDC